MTISRQRIQVLTSAGAALALEGEYDLSDQVLAVAALLENKTKPECTCRGYDPADPCGHGDTSEGCPRHDPNAVMVSASDDVAYDYEDSSGNRWNFSSASAGEETDR